MRISPRKLWCVSQSAGDPGPDGAADHLLDAVLVVHTVGQCLLDGGDELAFDILEDRAVLRETTGVDVRTSDEVTAVEVHHRNHRDEPLLPQDQAVNYLPILCVYISF